jgi:hypothetical protein
MDFTQPLELSPQLGRSFTVVLQRGFLPGHSYHLVNLGIFPSDWWKKEGMAEALRRVFFNLHACVQTDPSMVGLDSRQLHPRCNQLPAHGKGHKTQPCLQIFVSCDEPTAARWLSFFQSYTQSPFVHNSLCSFLSPLDDLQSLKWSIGQLYECYPPERRLHKDPENKLWIKLSYVRPMSLSALLTLLDHLLSETPRELNATQPAGGIVDALALQDGLHSTEFLLFCDTEEHILSLILALRHGKPLQVALGNSVLTKTTLPDAQLRSNRAPVLPINREPLPDMELCSFPAGEDSDSLPMLTVLEAEDRRLTWDLASQDRRLLWLLSELGSGTRLLIQGSLFPKSFPSRVNGCSLEFALRTAFAQAKPGQPVSNPFQPVLVHALRDTLKTLVEKDPTYTDLQSKFEVALTAGFSSTADGPLPVACQLSLDSLLPLCAASSLMFVATHSYQGMPYYQLVTSPAASATPSHLFERLSSTSIIGRANANSGHIFTAPMTAASALVRAIAALQPPHGRPTIGFTSPSELAPEIRSGLLGRLAPLLIHPPRLLDAQATDRSDILRGMLTPGSLGFRAPSKMARASDQKVRARVRAADHQLSLGYLGIRAVATAELGPAADDLPMSPATPSKCDPVDLQRAPADTPAPFPR